MTDKTREILRRAILIAANSTKYILGDEVGKIVEAIDEEFEVTKKRPRQLTLRTKESEQAYRDAILRRETMVSITSLPRIQEFTGDDSRWTVVRNEYPYDLAHNPNQGYIAILEDNKLTAWDWEQLQYVACNANADQIIWNMPHAQSQPNVFHIHLVQFKGVDDE